MNMHVEVSSYEVFVEARKDMDKSVFFLVKININTHFDVNIWSEIKPTTYIF